MESHIIIISCVLLSTICVTAAMYSNKKLEGYPAGFLANCPNQTKPIPKEDLKYLSIIVHGARSDKRISYNYYQAHKIAKNPHMDWSKKTMVYLGGYMDSPEYFVAKALERHYIKLGYNVWLIDELYFVVDVYPVVARKVRYVGQHIAEMFAIVQEAGILDPSSLELVGLSLGCHTLSFVAKSFTQLTGKKVGRITGLDPSGPCYRDMGPADRLDESDADFVDVIHTNIDGFGMAAPIGHVNFYINGGEFQLNEVSWMPCAEFCSHMKAYFVWLSSLENLNSFIAIKCNSVQQARFNKCYDNYPQETNVMGINVDKEKKGIFYLSIKNSFPYYLGKKGLKKEYDSLNVLFKKYIPK